MQLKVNKHLRELAAKYGLINDRANRLAVSN